MRGYLIGQVGQVRQVGQIGPHIDICTTKSEMSDLSDKAFASLFIGEELGEYFIEGLFGLVLFEVEGLPVGNVEVFSGL